MNMNTRTRVTHPDRDELGTVVIRPAAWTPNDLTAEAPDADMAQVLWDGYNDAQWEYTAELAEAEPKRTGPADHRDAIVDVAAAHGLQVIVDSGGNGNVLVLGDDEHAHDYLHGMGVLGWRVDVHFNEHGEVVKARATLDNAPMADVTGARGSAGERLLWALQMLAAVDDEAHIDR